MNWTTLSAVLVVLIAVGSAPVPRRNGPSWASDWYGKDRAAWTDASNSKEAPALKTWYAGEQRKTPSSAHLRQHSQRQTGGVRQHPRATAYYDWTSWVIEPTRHCRSRHGSG